MAAKTHFSDEHGPICGIRQGYTAIVGPKDLREVRTENLREITCRNRAKKLREWGFAIQHFTEAVQDALSK